MNKKRIHWSKVISCTVFSVLAAINIYCISDGPIQMMLKESNMFIESEVTVSGMNFSLFKNNFVKLLFFVKQKLKLHSSGHQLYFANTQEIKTNWSI